MNPTKSFKGAPGAASPEYNPGRSGTKVPGNPGRSTISTYKNNVKEGMGLPSTKFGTEKGSLASPMASKPKAC